MYNPLLTAFVCAADCGSFTKAAEKLYLSPTAVMKQINTLESHLQLQLISRTNQASDSHRQENPSMQTQSFCLTIPPVPCAVPDSGCRTMRKHFA